VGRNKQPKILPELRSRHPKSILQNPYTARNLGCAVPADALRDLVPAYMNNLGYKSGTDLPENMDLTPSPRILQF
jgi:hypothetical protein